MDWNGWHSAAQARGDGLRPELVEGLERQPNKDGLKPRRSRARKLSRSVRLKQQSE